MSKIPYIFANISKLFDKKLEMTYNEIVYEMEKLL